jgi:hypothetical protein
MRSLLCSAAAYLLFGVCTALGSEPGAFDRTLSVSGPLNLDVSIDGVGGPAETVTSSGRTEISNAAAAITVNGHLGAIVIRDAGGPVSIRNQSGGDTHNLKGQIGLGGPLVNLNTHSSRIEID